MLTDGLLFLWSSFCSILSLLLLVFANFADNTKLFWILGCCTNGKEPQKDLPKLYVRGKRWQMSSSRDQCKGVHLRKNNWNHIFLFVSYKIIFNVFSWIGSMTTVKEMFHLFTYPCLWFFFGTTLVCTTLPISGGVNIPFVFRLAAQSPSAPVLCIAHVKNSFKLHHCPLFHAVHKHWGWQPLQKPLNPVKYLGVLVGCFSF